MSIEDRVADYYCDKLQQHGATPQGVDWNSSHSQMLRFQQLSKVLPESGSFSVNDIGCGYGAYLDYLLISSKDGFDYTGYDIAEDMVVSAKQRFGEHNNAEFICSKAITQVADFSVASGIFNVKVGTADETWYDYIIDTLTRIDASSRHGFAFNCLTVYSDKDKMRDTLYYSDPLKLFDHCKRNFSRNVAILHDYELYEFTILVRK